MEKRRCQSKFVKQMIAMGSVLTMTTGLFSSGNMVIAEENSAGNVPANGNDETTKYIDNGVKSTEKTNVMYIILDDIGFSDLGAYGSEIKTPNIDQLAADGLIYNNFQACPFSSATRASLLTGRENNSVGMGHVANVNLEEEYTSYQGKVTDEAGLISEILDDYDYSSYGIGKWHIAPINTVTPAGPFDYWPLSKGFDRYYGFLDGETDQYSPQLINGNEFIDYEYEDDYTLNEDMLSKAKSYIGSHVSIYPDKPFFMNYAFGTAHSPQQVPESYSEAYEGVYDVGWDVIRQARFERQKELGIIPESAILTESDTRNWNTLSDEEQTLYVKFMENYAGYITQADEEIGKLINYLKEIDEYDNTLIFLIGDNGATSDGGADGTDSFIGSMTGFYQADISSLLDKYALIGSEGFEALYPKGWAQVSNTPFAGYKGSLYSGALRNPLIVSWPNGIEATGEIREQYVQVADITPTVMDILDVEAPASIDGVEQMAFYGVSFASTFSDEETKETRTEAFFYHSGVRSMYADGWRAIGTPIDSSDLENLEWELYHTAEDYSEAMNVADGHPEILEELQVAFMDTADELGLTPFKALPNNAMAYVKKGSAGDRTSFTYYPEMTGLISTSAAPAVLTNSFSITVPLTYEAGDEGVLAAMGGEMGGYVLYIKDGKPVFDWNYYGDHYIVWSDQDMPSGETVLKVQFERGAIYKGPAYEGVASMYINDVKVGEKQLQTAPIQTIEGLTIGYDGFVHVSDAYEEMDDYTYTGEFDYIQYEMIPFIPAH